MKQVSDILVWHMQADGGGIQNQFETGSGLGI
jgi:hypothetical protein